MLSSIENQEEKLKGYKGTSGHTYEDTGLIGRFSGQVLRFLSNHTCISSARYPIAVRKPYNPCNTLSSLKLHRCSPMFPRSHIVCTLNSTMYTSRSCVSTHNALF